jgi:hypothetical protein
LKNSAGSRSIANLPFLSVFAFLSVIPAGNLLSLQNQWRRKSKAQDLRIQTLHQSRVPHIWRALCARCVKPQTSAAGWDFGRRATMFALSSTFFRSLPNDKAITNGPID